MASVSSARQLPGVGAGRALSRRWRRAVRRALRHATGIDDVEVELSALDLVGDARSALDGPPRPVCTSSGLPIWAVRQVVWSLGARSCRVGGGPLGYGVIGNTRDSDSLILGSSPSTPAIDQV